MRTKRSVYYWILEINEEGEVCKEIAFDIKNQIVSFAPYKNNRGQWVDSSILLNVNDEYEEITPSQFEKLWEMRKDFQY